MKHTIFLTLICCVILFSVGLVSAVGTYPAVDPDMVLYYHFNNQSAYGENDTRVYDFSGNGNNGTANNTQFQAGTGILNDGSFSFNGVNSTLVSSHTINNPSFNFSSTGFTVSVWINTSDKVNNMDIISHYLGGTGNNRIWSLIIIQNKTRLAGYSDGSSSVGVTGTSIITDKKLHNLVGVYNKTDLLIYVDGILENFNQLSNLWYSTSSPVALGIGRVYNYFNGSIDEAIIYNRSLSSVEIQRNYMTYQYQNITNINSCGTYGGSSVIYNLTSDLVSTTSCIILTGSFVTLEGNGHSIFFSNNNSNLRLSHYGVLTTSGSSWINVQNLRIYTYNESSEGKIGIYGQGNYNTYSNNIINSTGHDDGYGIFILRSVSSTIFNNTIYTGSYPLTFSKGRDNYGISIFNSNFTNVTGNYISSFGITAYGIANYYSKFGYFSQNIINVSYTRAMNFWGDSLNNENLTETSESLSDYNQTIDSSNLANGKPINYTFGLDNLVFSNTNFSNYGLVIIAGSNNISIINSSFYLTGVNLYSVTNSLINNNSFSLTTGSLNLGASSLNNLITNNYFSSSGGFIVETEGFSNNNTFSNNLLISSGSHVAYNCYQTQFINFINNSIDMLNTVSSIGLEFDMGCNNSVISSNVINNTVIGVIVNTNVNNISFSNNFVYANQSGFYILSGAFNNTFSSNNVFSNDIGFNVGSSTSSTYGISRNNFLSKNNINSVNANVFVWNSENNIIDFGFGNTYVYVNNSNFTQFQGLTSALLTNGTSLCNGSSSNLALNSGQVNITLQPSESACVFDNANLTEGITRGSGSCIFPLAFGTDTTTEKHVTSTLDTSINLSITLNADCNTIGRITYVSDLGFNQTWNSGDYTCSNGHITFNNLPVDPSLTSNIFTLEYNQQIQGICNEGGLTFYGAVSIVGVLLTIFIIGLVLAILVLSFRGTIDIGNIRKNIDFKDFLIGIMTIMFTFLLLVTIAFIFNGFVCSALGG